MNQQTDDLRKQTLDLVVAGAGAAAAAPSPVTKLIEAWLASLEEEDLAGITPESLASVLWQGFSEVMGATPSGCRVGALRYVGARNVSATALLIVNPDMPFLGDSIVMAMRRLRIASRAVLNAVLSVRRGPDGGIVHVERATTGKDPLESYVLCLLSEELAAPELAALIDSVRMVAGNPFSSRKMPAKSSR